MRTEYGVPQIRHARDIELLEYGIIPEPVEYLMTLRIRRPLSDSGSQGAAWAVTVRNAGVIDVVPGRWRRCPRGCNPICGAFRSYRDPPPAGVVVEPSEQTLISHYQHIIDQALSVELRHDGIVMNRIAHVVRS